LQLVVKHYKVYYPVRHHLIQHVVTSIQRLGFTATATIEQKRLAVDLCEIVIKWEIQRIREEMDQDSNVPSPQVPSPGQKHSIGEQGGPDPKRRASSASGQSQPIGSPPPKPAPPPAEANKPLEKVHCDSIVNYLLRLACQVNDAQVTYLMDRCVLCVITLINVT
jgi:transformation/transcription domain-associated protein